MTVFQHDGVAAGFDTGMSDDCVSSVGVVRCSPESKQLQWSASAALLHFGRPDDTPTVDSFAEFAHLDDRAIVMDSLERFVAGKPVRSHYRLVNPAGETRWVVMVSDRQTDTGGREGESSGFVIDVTRAVQSGVTSAVAEMLESRATIEQVKGVLMAVHGLTADQAFGVLTRCSQETNTKVRDLSRRFLTTIAGRLPGVTRAQVDRLLLTASLELAVDNGHGPHELPPEPSEPTRWPT
jgi:ANTAR domain/PAS fold